MTILTLGGWVASSLGSASDSNRVTELTKEMRTRCVGRFLVDLPKDAHVSLSHGSIDGFDITTYPDESDSDFAERVKKREAEINSEKNRFGQKNMESAQEIRGKGRTGKIFVFGRTSTHVYHGEEKVVLNGVSVNAYLRTGGVSFSFVATDYDPKLVGNLPSLVAKVRSVPDSHMPVEPGFCIDRAVVVDPLSADQGERIVLFAGLPNHPDVGIVFSSMAGTKPGPGLLKRNAENRAKRFAFLRGFFTTLREGPRTINGLRGEELALKVREINFATTYGFDWEMGGKENDVLAPFLTLELQAGINPRAGGPPVQSTLSESALKDLWDTISSSIRVRPAVEPKVAEARPAGASLGTYATAGDKCPESGWWLCGEGGGGIGVLGGQRQYLKKGQGSLLPAATFRVPGRVFGKSTGEPAVIQRRSVWQLVRSARAPETAKADEGVTEAAQSVASGPGSEPPQAEAPKSAV